MGKLGDPSPKNKPARFTREWQSHERGTTKVPSTHQGQNSHSRILFEQLTESQARLARRSRQLWRLQMSSTAPRDGEHWEQYQEMVAAG